ncbi:MAG: hypothetical protein KC944_15195 [Candidatus Omnitrophica bacterium]|nr:hypothetical protein [Candidatus Omnitrophota bacterium]MCA9423712.1 hypothetical protein [Candidatus Omnitrophota bacterium]
MLRILTLSLVVCWVLMAPAFSAPQVDVQVLAENRGDLPFQPSADDDINLNVATMTSPTPWHPVNTNPADQEAAFTDGLDLGPLTGLLNDFLGGPEPIDNENVPAAVAEWYFSGPQDLYEIRVFSGNSGGRDGRIFHHYDVATTTSANPALGPFTPLIEEVIPVSTGFGSVGNPNPPGLYEAALTVVNNDSDGPMISGVTGIQITFYMVSETSGAFRDDWDAGNGDDRDGAPPAFESPLIYEVDAFFTDQNPSAVENWSIY